MKFDCGETELERLSRMYNWHRWFAWYPVRIEPHDCRWLETVERRRGYGWGGYWDYRAIDKN